MKIKLFGKDVFEWRTRRHDALLVPSESFMQDSKFLPDFHKDHSSSWGENNPISNYVVMETTTPGGLIAVPKGQTEKAKQEAPKKKITPKEVFNLKTLNDKEYKLATDPAYVDAQIDSFKDKLNLVKSEEYDMRRGVEQIASIVVRLENRKKYKDHKDFFEQYPYTTTSKIGTLTKEHDNLQLGQVAQFLADMPKEATDTMKAYNAEVTKLCGKQAVFYIIADKKDFKKTESRRDPILLAQSPFGHVWQILGAWDEEMLFLEEL